MGATSAASWDGSNSRSASWMAMIVPRAAIVEVMGYNPPKERPADAPARHEIFCAEFCGIGHHLMTGRILLAALEDGEEELADLMRLEIAGRDQARSLIQEGREGVHFQLATLVDGDGTNASALIAKARATHRPKTGTPSTRTPPWLPAHASALLN